MDTEERLCPESGRLQYRNTPSDHWHYYSPEILSAMIVAERKAKEDNLESFRRVAAVVDQYIHDGWGAK